MKRLLSTVLSLAVAGAFLVTVPAAEAKRLGGGKSVGMQRQAPANQPANAAPPPSQQAAPTSPAAAPQQAAPMAGAAAPAAAAANAGKRSWLGPVAGLAAGLGLAALASHFGFGEGLANFMTIALFALVAVVALRWLMGRFAGGAARGALQPAGAGAPWANRPAEPSFNAGGSAAPMQRAALAPTASVALPDGVDAADFERVAKQIFIRLQAVNDAGAVEDLRKFTTPELFAALRLDVLERGNAQQKTDVVQLAAQLVDAQREGAQWVASVRFSGLIRELADGGAQPFDETWHLVKPADGPGDWLIAGIQPTA